MRVELEIPDYQPADGLRAEWEPGFQITSSFINDGVRINSNKAGLISLARLLLTLAQERVPPGSHWHLDDSNSLEDGSVEIVIEKI